MKPSAEIKLQELRSKTNQQLASLINHKLDRGLAFARVLAHGDDWASTDHFYVNAERAYSEANAWMSMLDGAPQAERRRLDVKLAQLRDALARIPAAQLRAQAAC